EYHDRETVVLTEYPQGLVSRIGDALNVRPHAGADVQKQQEIHRHVFACEVADRLGPPLLAHNKIGNTHPCNGAIVAIHHLRVHANQGHVTAEYDVLVLACGDQSSTSKGKP